jgi:predicted DNA-binding ribbon-helix-helix protein
MRACPVVGRTASDVFWRERAVKRSVMVAGRKTSVSLEDEFWLALRRIANTESRTIGQLIEGVSRQDDRNLSSALRVYILRFHERLAGIG